MLPNEFSPEVVAIIFSLWIKTWRALKEMEGTRLTELRELFPDSSITQEDVLLLQITSARRKAPKNLLRIFIENLDQMNL